MAAVPAARFGAAVVVVAGGVIISVILPPIALVNGLNRFNSG